MFRRLADLDWHVHPHVDGEDLPKILPTLEASGVKIVVDHLGRPDPKSGINSEGFKALLRSIDKGRTWVKVSGGYRLGPQAMEYARELLRVAGAGSPGLGERLSLSSATRASFPIRPRSTG